MKTLFSALLLCAFTVASAQTPKPTPPAYTGPTTQAYGKVDQTDIDLKECDFEKDANAEVLFDIGKVFYNSNLVVNMQRHKRIKIFNDNGKKEANIRLEYYSGGKYEFIDGIEAQTINYVNGKIEITKLDKKSIFSETIDKGRSAYIFSFPNVKPGSIIEYKYNWGSNAINHMPDWYFQGPLPTRYSEIDTQIPDMLYFREQHHIRDRFVLNKPTSESASAYNLDGRNRALANVHSMPDEPYMSSLNDNLQSIFFQLTSVKPINGYVQNFSDSWPKVGYVLAENEDFGQQLKKKLVGEDVILAKAKTMTNQWAKINYIYKEVQNTMKWNGSDRWYTNEGVQKAWEKKTGNSAEVNLILCHLLEKAGVEVYPMVVSTRSHGKVNPAFPFLYQFNRAVVYLRGDLAHNHVLDATDKFNNYTETPNDLLNSTGLFIDRENKRFNTVFLSRNNPVQQIININADVKADGKMEGNAQVINYAYNRIKNIKRYQTDGEQKFVDYIRNNDNNIKISDLKFENLETDSLPLNQTMNFKADLNGSDGNYIYFNPAQFSPLRTNPFLSETRQSDVDFGYRDNFSLTGKYTIPAGYKSDVLPKSTTLDMPDNSISFKRIVGEQNGAVVVRYVVDFKKVIFFKEDYDLLFDFYKRVHELMNEQIVLKKA